jgi:hypothetical protein
MKLFAEDVLTIGKLRDQVCSWKQICMQLGFTIGAAKSAYKRQTAKSKADFVGSDYKVKAKEKLRMAIKQGWIRRPLTCEQCGKSKNRIVGHHPDYSKPFDAMWLCVSCHGFKHPDRDKSGKQSIRKLFLTLHETTNKNL